MPRTARVAAACLTLLAFVPGTALAKKELPKPAKAGVAVLDASWHVGAAAGSHGSSAGLEDLIGVHGMDPAHHSVTRVPSYGIESRMDVRALVVEGANGKRVALVKNDLFIPQDLLWRRTAQILEEGGSGIGHANLTMAVTHDHSSPYTSSPDWGVAAASQDAFDSRFYEYYAERMAAAVEKAADTMKPVRVGAAVSYFDKTARNSMGGEYSDDGSPAGYWTNDVDHNMTVVRFDDVTNANKPKPLAILMNWSMHPETLPSGLDMVTGDYVAPLERMVDRESGAKLIFTQASVGTSEPEESDYDQPYDSVHGIHERLEFHYKGYEASERAGRLMADSVLNTWRDIAAGTPESRDRYVPFQTGFPVGVDDRWFPGPISHPYPSFGNCKVDPALDGRPSAPTDLPTCQQQDTGLNPGLSADALRQAGIPVPDHYSPPAYTGLEEDLGIHLQAFKLGDILFTVCSCEQWKDQSQNIRTRTDRTPGNEYLGYDFSKECNHNADGTWSCPDPFYPIGAGRKDLPPISDAVYQRMKAEVNNDARGWDQVAYTPFAESEPENPQDIKGNYTHDDTAENASYGYGLTVPIAMANDYNGYIATYREYQNRDHYRKALTGWGPHSSDYIATRLVGMARKLNGSPELACETGDCMIAASLGAKVTADQANQDGRARALGAAGSGSHAAWTAGLPDTPDPGKVAEPADAERFGASFFTWNGGDNYTDNPRVTVERRVGRDWEDFADQSGEVPVTVVYPTNDDLPAWAAGTFGWKWTAHFEAFVSQVDPGDRPLATPAGDYRFVVDGKRRKGHAVVPYHLESRSFRVEPWSGITADDLRVDPGGGSVSFTAGPTHVVDGVNTQGRDPGKYAIGPIDYPDSYTDAPRAKFINPRRSFVKDPAAPGDASKMEWYCFQCTFRPWVDAGDASSAFVTIVHPNGSKARVAATKQGDRWTAPIGAGDHAYVERGDLKDRFGNFNGQRSATV